MTAPDTAVKASGAALDKGAATAEISDSTSWEQLNATMKFYAQRFRSRFAAQ